MAYPEGFADENELNIEIVQAIGEVDELYQEVAQLHKSWLQNFGSCSSQRASRYSGDFIYSALSGASDDGIIDLDTLYAITLDLLENEQDETRFQDQDTLDEIFRDFPEEQDEPRIEDQDSRHEIFLDLPEEQDEPKIEEEKTAKVLPSCPTED